jgi:hypothetical protein
MCVEAAPKSGCKKAICGCGSHGGCAALPEQRTILAMKFGEEAEQQCSCASGRCPRHYLAVTGFILVAFVVLHLTVNMLGLWPARFQSVVNHIHGLGAALPILEIGLLFIPLTIHVAFGLRTLRREKLKFGVEKHHHGSDPRQWLQRVPRRDPAGVSRVPPRHNAPVGAALGFSPDALAGVGSLCGGRIVRAVARVRFRARWSRQFLERGVRTPCKSARRAILPARHHPRRVSPGQRGCHRFRSVGTHRHSRCATTPLAHYYRCSHKNKLPHAADRSLIPEGKFAEEVKRNVALVTIPDDWKEKFLAQIELWQNEEAQVRQRRVDRIKAELAALKSKIDRLNIAFTEGGIELAEFKELKNPLIVQKTLLEQKLVKVERGESSPIEPLKNLILEANKAQKWVFENNWLEMKSFLQNVGLNRQIRSQTLTVSFKKPFDSLAKTTVAAQLAASEAERNSVWWRRRELNPERRFSRTIENTDKSTVSMVLFIFAFSFRCNKKQQNPFWMIEKDRKSRRFILAQNSGS